MDADCWPATGFPTDIAGTLDLPRPEWQEIAGKDRLLLKLQAGGELYRLILDSVTGRFLGRRL